MADNQAAENTAGQRRMRDHARSRTLLVVEDDTPLRRLLCKVLTDASYRILVATNGEEALLLATEYANPIDLLLTDVMMRGMNGPELTDLLRQSRPDLQVLFMSGYDRKLIGEHGQYPAVAFLPKPFSPTTLVVRINELMAGLEREPGVKRYSASA